MIGKKPLALILCTGNSCRSQMAEGFLGKYQGDRFEVASGGTRPKDQVHPMAIRVMAEVGIDISRQRPTDLNQYLGIAPVKHLLIVCDKANASCPRIWPGTFTRTYMPFDDPADFNGSVDDTVAIFRRVRDEIGEAMKTWNPRNHERASGMRKLVAECIGTFALVFAGTGAIVINDVTSGSITHVGIAMTFGLIVMAMIYAVGDVSGAHLNPAVTIAFWVAHRFPGRAVGPYIASQLIGGLAASGLLRAMFPEHLSLGATIPSGPVFRSFVLEFVLTALMMFAILAVSSGSKEKGMLAGIAIGGVIALEAMFAGPICGASMNPARSIAPAVVSGNLQSLWVYVVAPVVGAVAVAPWHRWLHEPPERLEPAIDSKKTRDKS